MSKPRRIDLDVMDRTVGSALADRLISENDLLRLKAIARLHARGLPGMSWADLLHEAIARTLAGARKRPADVAMVAFIAGVMRSIKSEQWRRTVQDARMAGALAAHAGTVTDPEREFAAIQELAAIDRLFVDDSDALKVLSGLAHGLSAEEIQKTNTMSKTDYESTRKRIRRRLLREGLVWRAS